MNIIRYVDIPSNKQILENTKDLTLTNPQVKFRNLNYRQSQNKEQKKSKGNFLRNVKKMFSSKKRKVTKMNTIHEDESIKRNSNDSEHTYYTIKRVSNLSSIESVNNLDDLLNTKVCKILIIKLIRFYQNDFYF